jgi:hypothetical protein
LTAVSSQQNFEKDGPLAYHSRFERLLHGFEIRLTLSSRPGLSANTAETTDSGGSPANAAAVLLARSASASACAATACWEASQ